MKIVITMLFGLESVVKDEIYKLGSGPGDITVNDGRIEVDVRDGSASSAVAKLNMNLRAAERVLLKFGESHAGTFDELFEAASVIPWEEHIPKGWAFHVNGYSLKSKLYGVPSCQSVIKKAIVRRLASVYRLNEDAQLPEDPRKGLIKIVFSIIKDEVSFMADTSGEGLHKRGYRPLTHTAPLKETLAAGLVILSGWRYDSGEVLLDPMCGTGTIPIEAALLASDTAPGISRGFAAEKWPGIFLQDFARAREEAMDLRKIIKKEQSGMIFGSDNDPASLAAAGKNASSAGIGSLVSFSAKDALAYDKTSLDILSDSGRILIVTNPPYGERMLDTKQAADLFAALGRNWLYKGAVIKGLRLSIIAPTESFENEFGAIADKRRKLYNGKIQCNMYHYFKSGRSVN